MLKKTILTIVVLLSFSPFLYGEIPTPTKHSNEPQKQASTSQAHAKIISDAAQSQITMIPLLVAPNTQIKTSNKTKNEDDRSSADWWLVYFTAALVAVVFFQFIWMVRQEKWMRRNVEIAQKSADAAEKSAAVFPSIERAYLFVKITMKNPEAEGIAGITYEESEYNSNNAKIIVTNHGKTPALITGIPYTTKVLNNTEIDKFIADFITDNYRNIPSGTTILDAAMPKTPIPAGFMMDKHLWNKITMGTAFLTCLGCIHYDDVFGNPHKTVFCWKYEQYTGFHPDKDPKRNERK